jgi:hypothetical protein
MCWEVSWCGCNSNVNKINWWYWQLAPMQDTRCRHYCKVHQCYSASVFSWLLQLLCLCHPCVYHILRSMPLLGEKSN